MTAVLVTVPNLHWIHQHVVAALLRIHGDSRYRLSIELPSARPFENNLHSIIADRLLRHEFDFWLSIDADNPPRRNPLDLVAFDLDIVGLPTPIWHYRGDRRGERPIYWNAYDADEASGAYREHLPRAGLQEVDAIGTGCFLVARRVFESPALQKGAFSRTLHRDGTVEKGNDIAFCERARAAGFRVFCHFDYPCNHFCELELNEVAAAIEGMK